MDRIDYIREAISIYDFSNASILDAGTGKSSARFLVDLKPKVLTCVAFTGDIRKGKTTEEILQLADNYQYKVIYGDLADSKLFSDNSFDFILADQLLGELAVSKVMPTLENFYRWLSPGGKVFIADREFYQKPEIQYEYVSMGETKGNANLSVRSNQDIVELIGLFLAIPKEIILFDGKERNFDYPSLWISLWLGHVGYKKIAQSFFESEISLKKEFLGRLEWARQRIGGITNRDLKSGLLKELEILVNEFDGRNIGDEEVFLRKYFFFQAEK